jgi:hypothetical protein
LELSALTVKEIAEQAGVPEETASRTVRRHERAGRVVKLSETKPIRWGRRR